MNFFQRFFGAVILCGLQIVAALPAHAQEPVDLFADAPRLSDDFIRICTWNLRHINLEGDARVLLAGDDDTEDFAILTATFAKANDDLGLDLVAVVEHQPRVNAPNRLEQIRAFLNNNGANHWLSDESRIVYDNPNSPFSGLQFGLLWNARKVTIDPSADQLLEPLEPLLDLQQLLDDDDVDIVIRANGTVDVQYRVPKSDAFKSLFGLDEKVRYQS